MDRWQKIWIALLLGVSMGVATFSLGFVVGRDRADVRVTIPGGSGAATLQEAYDQIVSSSIDPPSEKALTRAAIKAMVELLKEAGDEHALFYTPSDYRSVQELTSGTFSGIGVWLKEKGENAEIISVLPSSPALAAGVKKADRIITVDDDSIVGLPIDDVVNLIKGPEGTDVVLGISRGGDTLEIKITRATIELPNVRSNLTAGDLGYVRLFGFARGAGDQVRKRVERLTEAGAEGIILDLRDNGGGLFSEAITVASVFIADGEIVRYEQGRSEAVSYEAEGEAFADVPLVILVNEGTASASEIVAGAMQDRDRAILVGTQTYGKGSVQEVFPLLDASALKLTVGAYLTPGGRQINGLGIEPDVAIDGNASAQRQRAVEILKGILLSTVGAQG